MLVYHRDVLADVVHRQRPQVDLTQLRAPPLEGVAGVVAVVRAVALAALGLGRVEVLEVLDAERLGEAQCAAADNDPRRLVGERILLERCEVKKRDLFGVGTRADFTTPRASVRVAAQPRVALPEVVGPGRAVPTLVAPRPLLSISDAQS